MATEEAYKAQEQILNNDYVMTIKASPLMDVVTMDYFKDPVIVPECGHTFDRKVLQSLSVKRCPLCNAYLKGDPEKFRNNWVIVDILNLNIPRPTKEEIEKYDAEMAYLDSSRNLSDKSHKLLQAVLSHIKIRAKAGHHSDTFDTKMIAKNEDLIDGLINDLKARKFEVEKNYDSLEISWNHNPEKVDD